MVTSLTGATDDRVGKVVRLAGGSPLLIEQLAAADLDSPDGAAAVTHPMTMRLDQLGPSGRRLAQLGSLGDGHLAYHLLEQAFGVPEEFEEAVDQALDAGLLEYRTGTHEFTFTHALLREAAEATLTPTQRLRGHRRWAETLTDRASHAGEAQLRVAAAEHWAESGAETETFASALAAAGVTARLGASRETALLLLRAWQLWDRIPEASVVAARSRDDLLVDTVDALVEASRNLDAMNLLDDEIAASSGEDLYVRRLCLRLARSDARENLGENDDDALYDEALDNIDALTGPHATRLAVSPLSSLAWHLAARHPDQADRVTRQSMELSQQFGHPADIAYTTSMVAYRLSLRGQHAEALAVIGSGLEDQAVRVIDRMQVAMIRADCIGRAGRFREAAARGEKTVALVPDPQLAPVQWSFTVMRTCVWLKACGEWTRAAKLYEALRSLTNENWLTSLWTASTLSLFASDRGDIDEADRLAQQAWDMLPPDEDATLLIIRDGVRLAVAEVAAARGKFDEARAVLMPLVAMPSLEAYADMWPVVAAAARIEGERSSAHGRCDHQHRPGGRGCVGRGQGGGRTTAPRRAVLRSALPAGERRPGAGRTSRQSGDVDRRPRRLARPRARAVPRVGHTAAGRGAARGGREGVGRRGARRGMDAGTTSGSPTPHGRDHGPGPEGPTARRHRRRARRACRNRSTGASDPTRAGGAPAPGPWRLERRGCGRAVHLAEDGERSRVADPGQARRDQPVQGRSGCVRGRPRPADAVNGRLRR